MSLEAIEDTLREPITAANAARIKAKLESFRAIEWRDRRYEEEANELINEGLDRVAEVRVHEFGQSLMPDKIRLS